MSLADKLRELAKRPAPIIKPDPYVVIPHARTGMHGGHLVEVWDVIARKRVTGDIYEATPDYVVLFVPDLVNGGHKHVSKRPVLEHRAGRFEIRKYLSAD